MIGRALHGTSSLGHETRRCACGTRVAPLTGMADPEHYDELPESDLGFIADVDPGVHRFTVHRGMAVALVIDTRDWYSGLLQAAMARVRLEGNN